MRYLVGLVLAAALVAVPLSVSAQASEEGEASEPNVVEAVPMHDSASQDAALQLTLDDDGVEVAPGYPPRFDEPKLRVKRARIGVVTSAGVVVVGSVLIRVASSSTGSDCRYSLIGPDEGSCTDWGFAVTMTSAYLVAASIIGLATSGGIMAARKRKLRKQEREWQELHTHRCAEGWSRSLDPPVPLFPFSPTQTRAAEGPNT